MFASHPEMDERLKKLAKTIKDKKLNGTVTMEARFHEHVTYTPVSLTAIATVEAGSAGLAGDSGDKKGDDKSADGEKKKKRGFGLSSLIAPSSGGEQKSAEVTGSGAARGVDTERNAKGGPNPKMVQVKVTAAELTSFKKEGQLN